RTAATTSSAPPAAITTSGSCGWARLKPVTSSLKPASPGRRTGQGMTSSSVLVTGISSRIGLGSAAGRRAGRGQQERDDVVGSGHAGDLAREAPGAVPEAGVVEDAADGVADGRPGQLVG